MPDVHTQTFLTGSRIEDLARENRLAKRAKYQRTYKKKQKASNSMVNRIVKGIPQSKQKKRA